ncbi:hypothetical protein L1049_024608 [Liquidambar formosana]|uniref:Uncharacterized protein n=1 Tax=Liquidambar formosana TaxID=63359 RepID=A0AAP0X590_LIQFO
MGNCLMGSKIQALQEEKNEPPKEEVVTKEIKSLAPSKLEPARRGDGGKKKTVTFKLSEENSVDGGSGGGGGGGGDSKGGVVRIRVVVTQRELQQLLNYKEGSKYSSVEQLLGAMKLRSKRISQVRTSEEGISWRPALESIPEDH